MEIAEYTIEVRQNTIPYNDWREDPRWDQLHEFARELFGDGVDGAHGHLTNPEADN